MNSGVSESTTTIRPGIIKGGLFRTAQGANLAFTFVLLTSLFLLWGFCNGMIDILNKHFQDTLRINKEQSGLVQAANYLAYFLMAVPAGFIAKKFGYKGGILVGLSLIAAGAFWFIPAVKIGTYCAFLMGSVRYCCGHDLPGNHRESICHGSGFARGRTHAHQYSSNAERSWLDSRSDRGRPLCFSGAAERMPTLALPRPTWVSAFS